MNSRLIIRLVLVLAAAGFLYWKRGEFTDRFDRLEQALEAEQARQSKSGGGAESAPSPGPEKVRGYDRFPGARLVEDEGNDGDSFHVMANGREIHLRLYFVDAPEKYLSEDWENQRRRVAEQGRELGGLSPEQAVEVGKAAKMFVERELSGKEFTVYTYWEEVYDSGRHYGFVELADGSYLGTKLVEGGLARIHTKGPGSKEKPVPTPDGASFHRHRDMLYQKEREAKKAKRGAWSL